MKPTTPTFPPAVAWARFQTWLRETHPRATGQAELVEALLELDPHSADLNQLEQRLWPMESISNPDQLFRRQDRLRRLMANQRKLVAQYNRLYVGQAPALILLRAKRAGGIPAPGVVARPSQAAAHRPAPPPAQGTYRAAYDDTTATIRWAQGKLSDREKVRIATWLIDPLVDRNYKFSDFPEYWGEEAIRLGCAHDVQLLTGRDVPLLKDPVTRWKMLALWAEACDAVGLCGRLKPTMAPLWAKAVQAPELEQLQEVRYRLRRMWLRSIAWSSPAHASFMELYRAQAEEALSRGRPHEALEIRIGLLKSIVYEGVVTDRPALLQRAKRQVMDMLRDTGAADTEFARRERQILHWTIRCHLLGDVPMLLQESEELRDWLAKNGFFRKSIQLKTHTVRLLRIQGDIEQALALAIRCMTLGIRYVDRAHLLFMTREMKCLLPHWKTASGNRQRIARALSFLETQLSEIVHSDSKTPAPAPHTISRQLAPLSALLPRMVEPDWQRLLSEVPDIQAPPTLFG